MSVYLNQEYVFKKASGDQRGLKELKQSSIHIKSPIKTNIRGLLHFLEPFFVEINDKLRHGPMLFLQLGQNSVFKVPKRDCALI